MKKKAIVWFRQDLRLHDNEAISDALRSADQVMYVYVFDERVFDSHTNFGFRKTGQFRAKFVLESVADLQARLRERGADLVIRIGKPALILAELAREIKASWVYCNRERMSEELQVQNHLEKLLWPIGVELRFTRGKMLYYTQDLPFPITHTPDTFTQFRKEVEKLVEIREPICTPTDLKPYPNKVASSELPTLSTLGYQEVISDERAALTFEGGETAALARLQHYLWDTDHVATYEETRNELIGEAYSTKFSPWLAQGCISPKIIYQEVRKYEETRQKNKSTYWVIFELMWRDFFRLQAKKNGNAIFKIGGTRSKITKKWNDDRNLLQKWIDGVTGVPFVDANMRELKATGFMSNRGRQNVASFLVNDLHINWLMGAEYFESVLTDYDVASNWGNWNYIAGVGADPREDRVFNILSQANRYDPQGNYIRLWCPELANLPNDKINRPDLLTAEQQQQFGVRIGTDYPEAIVKIDKWV